MRTVQPVMLYLLLPLAFIVAQTSGTTGAGKPKLETLWRDLASKDEGQASRALLAMAATPRETTAFLKTHLKPIKADAATVKKLVAKLDDDAFEAREEASRELLYLGKFARPHLQKTLDDGPAAEVKDRIRKVLDQMPDKPRVNPFTNVRSISTQSVNGNTTIMINGKVLDFEELSRPGPGPNPEWLRATRAVVLLEQFATPEARAILQTISEGDAEANLTKEAKTALRSVANKE